MTSARRLISRFTRSSDRIELRQDGRVVGEHARAFGRGGTVYNPWHYVLVLARKPGALRNDTPFKHWVLPASLERVRRKLRAAPDGDRQMVDILGAVLTDGLPAVEAACAEALNEGVHSADVILNILVRSRDPGPPVTVMTPEALRLTSIPRIPWTASCHVQPAAPVYHDHPPLPAWAPPDTSPGRT